MKRAALTAIVAVLAVWLAPAGAKSPTRAPGSTANPTAHPISGREVPLLRTANSRTYRRPDGTYEARISNSPVNYRDASGHWQPIDNDLRTLANGSLENRANSFKVHLPAKATGDVRVAHNGHELGFSLIGATTAAPDPSGAEATFESVLPHVDVAYEARSASLKETLTLDSPAAPATYTFALDAPGLRAVSEPSGGVAFRDADGHQRFRFAAPWMQDADGALSRAARYVVHHAGGTQTVELRLDRAWLDDPARRFPVRVDPTVGGEAERGCQLISGSQANVNECSEEPWTWIGRYEEELYRSLVTIPALEEIIEPEALVTDASLNFWFEEQTEPEPASIELYGVRRASDGSATWNRATASTAWTTAGGDLFASAESDQTLAPEHIEVLTGMGATRLAQGWVDGSDIVREVMIKASDEEIEHADLIGEFEIIIDYRFRTGVNNPYTYDHTELSDGSSLDYNVASGNVTVSSNDGFPGHDPRLMLGRYWNTQNTQDAADVGTFGLRARGDIGTIALHDGDFGASYYLAGLSGADEVFVKHPGASFEPTDGKDIDLAEHEDGSITVRFNDSESTWEFTRDSPHQLASVTERDGYTISATYDEEDRLARISDNDELVATFAYDESGDLETVTDQNEDVRRYTFDGSHRLTSYTSPDEEQTRYSYDGSGRLRRIDLPDGTAMKLSYFGGSGVVGSLTPVDAENVDGEPITGEGEHEYTTISRPEVHPTSYFHDDHLHVDVTQPDDGPGIEASGDVAKFAPTYDRGEAPYVIAVNTAGVPNGVEEVHLTANEATVNSIRATCESDCPQRLSGTVSFDPTEEPEGTYNLRLHAEDGDANTSTGHTWEVHVDRTAPTVSAEEFAATQEFEETEVDWNPGTDPDLEDESPGSPIVNYRYRYQIGAGEWSEWIVTDVPNFVIAETVEEETFGIEVKAVDAAGNIGPTASDVVTSEAPPNTVEDIEEASGSPSEEPWMNAEPDPFEGHADGPDSYSNAPEDEGEEEELLLRRSSGDDYHERPCGIMASPCGSYDGKAAADYAQRWYNNRNHDFAEYGDVDCTNFASQALRAGGMRFMRAHGVNTTNAASVTSGTIFLPRVPYLRGEGSWWSYFRYNSYTGKRNYYATHSWALARTLYRHLIEYGLARELRRSEKPRPGDLVFYNLHGTTPEGIDHTQVVVRNDRKGVHVAQHAPDRLRTMRDVILDHLIPDYRLGIDWIYVIVRPRASQANIPIEWIS